MEELSVLEQLCFTTTRIEASNSNGEALAGTGFFYNLQVDDKRVPLLVTNKHVVKSMVKGNFQFTEGDTEGKPICQRHFNIAYDCDFEQMWVMHPDDNVDLCALPISVLIRAANKLGHTLFYKCFDSSLIPKKDDVESFDAIEDIVMIGYPNGLWDEVNNMPINRRGITATHYRYDYNGEKIFVIDAACFPGSSGSPVIKCDLGSYRSKNGNINLGQSRLFLLGVLYAGPQLTVSGDLHVVTIPNVQQKVLSVSHIPNNLGFVIKSERILDFTPIFKEKMSRQNN